MKVAFYDPDNAVVKSFRRELPRIHSIHVRQQRNPILKNYASFYYPLLFSVMYPNNAYAKWLVSDSHLATVPSKTAPNLLCRNICFGSQGDDMGSGLSIADMKDLLRHHYDVVVFEWYKTLSVLNYINGGKNDASFTEVAEFHAGTQERFNALRAMFAELRRRGTKVYVLSDSTWIKPADPNLFDFFLKTIQQLDGQIKKEDLIYSNDDKLKTMKTNPIFSQLSRKRMTRNKKRTKKNY